MKLLLKYFFIFSLLMTSFNTHATEDQRVSHVVVVWLKEPGNLKIRDHFIQASRQLENLPGVLSRHVSAVTPSDRKKVDDTFDVAITVTFKNQQALKNYLHSKQHKKMVQDKLKPLVERIVIYNFGNQ
jgi:heme-degrading monooxygenase HmoA